MLQLHQPERGLASLCNRSPVGPFRPRAQPKQPRACVRGAPDDASSSKCQIGGKPESQAAFQILRLPRANPTAKPKRIDFPAPVQTREIPRARPPAPRSDGPGLLHVSDPRPARSASHPPRPLHNPAASAPIPLQPKIPNPPPPPHQ